MAVAFEMIFTASDDKGKQGTTTVNLPRTFSLVDYTTFGAAMATVIDATLAGRVERAELCLGVDLSALNNNNAAVSGDVENVGHFQFTTVNGRPVKVNVPALDDSMVQPNSNDINQVTFPIQQFTDAMELGINVGGTFIQPCDVGQDDIIDLEIAREEFRASGSRR